MADRNKAAVDSSTTRFLRTWPRCVHRLAGAVGILTILASCGNGTTEQDAVATSLVQVADTSDAPEQMPAVSEPEHDSEFARLISQLESGVDRLSRRSGYSAEVTMQERVDGELQDPQIVALVCRHEPFSTYLNWTQGPVGRELIYVAGENRDRVIVHPEGLRGRLVSRLTLDQDSPLIMSERRYPISEFGLLKLNERLLSILSGYAAAGVEATCVSQILEDSPRRETEYQVELSEPFDDDIYRRVIVLLDDEFSIATCLRGYAWAETVSETDENTLIESYEYRSIDFDHSISDATFDVSNPEYGFTR